MNIIFVLLGLNLCGVAFVHLEIKYLKNVLKFHEKLARLNVIVDKESEP